MELFLKLFFSLLATAIAGIPLWFYLWTDAFLAPEGFWQQLASIYMGLWLLGGAQVFFFVLWLIAITVIWKN